MSVSRFTLSPTFSLPRRRYFKRVRDKRDAESGRLAVDDRQADTVNRDRPLRSHLAAQVLGQFEPERRPLAFIISLNECASAVDVSTDEVSTEPIAYLQRTFQVDRASFSQVAQVRTRQRLGTCLGTRRYRESLRQRSGSNR